MSGCKGLPRRRNVRTSVNLLDSEYTLRIRKERLKENPTERDPSKLDKIYG